MMDTTKELEVIHFALKSRNEVVRTLAATQSQLIAKIDALKNALFAVALVGGAGVLIYGLFRAIEIWSLPPKQTSHK